MKDTTPGIPRKTGKNVVGVRGVEDTRRTWPKEQISANSDLQKLKWQSQSLHEFALGPMHVSYSCLIWGSGNPIKTQVCILVAHAIRISDSLTGYFILKPFLQRIHAVYIWVILDLIYNKKIKTYVTWEEKEGCCFNSIKNCSLEISDDIMLPLHFFIAQINLKA